MLSAADTYLFSICCGCVARRLNNNFPKALFGQRFHTSVEAREKRNHYETLGVSRNASNSEIKNAFFKQSMKCHPDKNPDDPRTHEKFVALNSAYTVLSKQSTRKHYDAKLASARLQRQEGPVYHNQQRSQSDMPFEETLFYKEYLRRQKDQNYYGFPPRPKTEDKAWDKRKQDSSLALCALLLFGGCLYFYSALRWSNRIRENMSINQMMKLRSSSPIGHSRWSEHGSHGSMFYNGKVFEDSRTDDLTSQSEVIQDTSDMKDMEELDR